MLSYGEFVSVAEDLTSLLTGAKLQRVIQPEADALVLEFFGNLPRHALTRERKAWLYLSTWPPYARMHLIEEPPAAPPEPPPFCGLLRKHLDGARLVEVGAIANERVLLLRFEGSEGKRALAFELYGASSNLYLLDAEDRVLDLLRPAPPRRGVVRGQVWPPPQRAGIDADEPLNRFAGLKGADLHLAIAESYHQKQRRDERTMLRRRTAKVLSDEGQYLERKSKALRRDLDLHDRYPEYLKKGELLKAYLKDIPSGAASVTLTDYDREGVAAPVVIKLDPAKSALDNAEHYFKRYHKGIVGAGKIGVMLESVTAARQELLALERDFSTLPDDKLSTFAANKAMKELFAKYYPGMSVRDLATRRLSRVSELRTTTKIRRSSRNQFARITTHLRPRRFTSADGWVILAGKSAESNDYLTFHIAGGNDYFFHIAEYPGAHVILRRRKGEAPSLETLLDCAQLALHYSQRPDLPRTQVRYVERKFVRKPKGAKPGLVIAEGGKTLEITADPTRLGRLKAKEVREVL